MQDQLNLLNMVMLVCAVLAALAFGVLVGYGTCKGLFAMLRAQARPLESERTKTSVASTLGS